MHNANHLETVLWPRYREPVASLCQALWALANPKQKDVKSPGWFNEIVEAQAKSMLMTVFASPQSWVIFPEPIPGFTVVVFKRSHQAATLASQEKITLRMHTLDQFSELARLVEKASVKLLRQATTEVPGEDVVSLENEDGNIFVFARDKMGSYLKALGFADEQIPQLLTEDDVEGFL